MEEQFYEGQENRVRIISSLSAKSLPVDVSSEFLFLFFSTLLCCIYYTLQFR